MSDYNALTQETLMVPRGRKGLSPLVLNMKKIHEIEAKIPEIERSTPMTLPNLVTSFTLGILEMAKIMTLVEMELKDAQRSLDEARAIAILEKVEGVLLEKKIKSTSDTREAALDLDKDVQEAQQKVDMLNAVSSFLSTKLKAIEMSYHASKKICDLYIKSPESTNYGGST